MRMSIRLPRFPSARKRWPSMSPMSVLSDIKFEVQHGVSSRLTFLRGSIAEPLARPAIEFRRDPIAIMLGEVGHALALGEILAHEAVGVLIGAAFPRVMRSREVEARGGGSLEPGVVVEFG